MKTMCISRTIFLSSALACTLAMQARADLITNGGFESGFSGWTRANQLGSDGQFFAQTGILSPVNSFTVPAPPQGLTAAMTDALGPGAHVLYQDFVVPSVVPGASIGFALFINNNNGALAFFNPSTLDFATPALNQQARVDILKTSADPFSVASADILQNLFQTTPGSPLLSGYNNFLIDLTTLLQAQQGQTLRLRFAETDNVAAFNLGVDNVSIDVGANAVPEPASFLMVIGALLGVGLLKRH